MCQAPTYRSIWARIERSWVLPTFRPMVPSANELVSSAVPIDSEGRRKSEPVEGEKINKS